MRPLVLVLLALVVAPLGDWCHVSGGATAYDERFGPWLGPSPLLWFVLPIAVLVVVLGEVAHRMQIGERPRPGAFPAAAGAVAALLGAWALSAALPFDRGAAPTVAIAALVLVGWAGFERTRVGLVLGVLAGAAGTAAELFLTSIGWFHYAPPLRHLGGVPAWLPAIHFAGGVAVAQIVRAAGAGSRARSASTQRGRRRSLRITASAALAA